jgi:four helix bundle protein
VAANYRAALRAKSDADFINKITIVLEEADESGFWIELAERAKLLPSKRLKALLQEAEELTKIFNATRSTTKHRTTRNHKS